MKMTELKEKLSELGLAVEKMNDKLNSLSEESAADAAEAIHTNDGILMMINTVVGAINRNDSSVLDEMIDLWESADDSEDELE